MNAAQIDETSIRRPLRLWPGVVAVALQWLAWLVAPKVLPEIGGWVMALGLLLGAVAVVVWWLLFSRAPWLERAGAIALTAAALAITPRFLHPSVAQGNMGFQFFLWAIPALSFAFVAWAVVSRRLARGPRWAALVAAVVLACGVWTLVRSKGLTGDASAEFTWRWSPSAEELLLARGGDESASPAPGAVTEVPAAWPGFRGPGRDGVVAGLRIVTDWSAWPPVELWRRPIGPGVSSFVVRGDFLYTQEQRGEEEIVSCYRASTGEAVWQHRDEARFWDSHVGAGPRATPAIAGDRVFTLGATGILNALDAGTGAVLWSRDAAGDTGAKVPYFGFSNSPLVVDDLLLVYTNALAAYDPASGDRRWTGPPSGGSYGSPHLLKIAGAPQIVLVTHRGMAAFAPADGALLWEHPWPGIGMTQPFPIAAGDLLVSQVAESSAPIGTRRVAVERRTDGWTVEERWTSNRLKPSFSPPVVHRGHAYGFDNGILASIDLEDGERNWKGGRYGSGQLLLLPDQDLLLVVTERGGLALVAATPDRFTELARFPAIEGKTWNQPALVGDLLLVRNGREMAAFRLPRAGR